MKETSVGTVLYRLIFFLWVVVPQGMGLPPFHRYSKRFMLEDGVERAGLIKD